MSDPFIGEIRMVPWKWAPHGWALCDGQELKIEDYTALFSLLGTTYGGDGRTTFNLPDLRGRVPIHQGQGSGLSNYFIGQHAGVEYVKLTENQMPSHSHDATTSADSATFNLPASTEEGTLPSPTDNYIAAPVLTGPRGSVTNFSATSDTQMAGCSVDISAETIISPSGGGDWHKNIQPYLCVNFIIALIGEYPPRPY